ncbi:4'-phosphopantetheinyl transferase superfamily protein [Streptomyces sp. NBC_00234]|uniref:4'-phosphopantetheinyl transferase family protein n=1 Tax=Streptomyces sp. NBC_00234 TaxID=2903638 RepID=UPI002E27DD52|nr:4'-phosphopantetheinyl transferase superfamily protein [Streptomyces sp. NBC_00234]
MIERILPLYVASAETCDEDAPPGTLFPEEEALVATSVAKRRHEFAAARWCARRTMAAVGLPPAPVLRGHRGMPLWPAGYVGSMTHCDGYRAAALAKAEDLRGLGVDAEPNAPLPSGVWEIISLPSERERLLSYGDVAAREAGSEPDGTGTVHWDRLLFSAKESVFKTWYPLTRIELDFSEADITFHRTSPNTTEGTLSARLLRSAPGIPPTLTGRWLVHDGIAATAVTLPG